MNKLGLTFGGGGARGAAHAGILYELEALNVKADLLTGTSIGAFVASMVAFSKTAKEIHQVFEKIDLSGLYHRPGNNPALSNINSFENALVDVIGRPDFAQADIPLAVVTTNLVTRQEVVLDEGDVVSAVMASMAFPILLPPVERSGLTLVDGGLVNNVPFDVARARGATQVIAIDLGNSAPYGTAPAPSQTTGLLGRAVNVAKRQQLFQVITSVTDIITDRSLQARMAISPPDLLIRPKMDDVGLIDFDMTAKAVLVGRKAIRENPIIIEKLRQWGINKGSHK